MAQFGCDVAQFGCDVAQFGCDVAQFGCDVAQFGCDVVQSGAKWLSRAQFDSVKKGVGLIEGRFEFNVCLGNSRRSIEPSSKRKWREAWANGIR